MNTCSEKPIALLNPLIIITREDLGIAASDETGWRMSDSTTWVLEEDPLGDWPQRLNTRLTYGWI